jgi:hypothetical protein
MKAWVAAGLTAVVMGERSRALLRRAAIYGLASAMNAAEGFAEQAKATADGAPQTGSTSPGFGNERLEAREQFRRPRKPTTTRSRPRAEVA